MKVPSTQVFVDLLKVKAKLFEDYPASDESMETLTQLATPDDDCSELLCATAAYYLADFAQFVKYLQQVDPLQLPKSERKYFEALTWIAHFQDPPTDEKLVEQFEIWLLEAQPELRILTLCQFLPSLALIPNKFPLLKQKLQTFMKELEASELAVNVKGFAVAADLYTSIFDDIDSSVQCSIIGFHQAKQFGMPNYEFKLLVSMGQAYVNNQRFSEALVYFQQALELTLTQSIHPHLLAQVYVELTIGQINQGALAIAESYYKRLELLVHNQQLPTYFEVALQLCQLFLAVETKGADFDNLWAQYLDLTDWYLQLNNNKQNYPQLEGEFLHLEARLYEQYTNNYEQLLYTYFTHLNYYREQTPAKYLALANLAKKIAKIYQTIADYPQAWHYYQQYAEMLNTWERQAVEVEFSSEYATFHSYLQQQKLQRLQSASASLNQLRFLDPLTQLYSRQYLEQVLQEKRQPTGCAVIDLDYFKKFNDCFGHQAGDLALQHVAKTIRQTLSALEIPFRYGGEEFLILSFAEKKPEFEQKLKELNEKIANIPLLLPNRKKTEYITASIGAYWGNQEQFNFSEAFKQADSALYKIKQSGRNQVAFYPNTFNRT